MIDPSHLNMVVPLPSLVLLELDPLHLDLVPDQLVHVRYHGAVLDVHQNKGGCDRFGGQRVKRPRSRPGIDEELVLLLVGLEFVRVPRNEDVHVQLALHQRQRLGIAPRHHLVAVQQPYPVLAHGHHLLLRIVEAGVVEVAAYYVDVRGQRLQVVVGFLRAQVARAQDMMDTTGNLERRSQGD